jgi:hypothetical protein
MDGAGALADTLCARALFRRNVLDRLAVGTVAAPERSLKDDAPQRVNSFRITHRPTIVPQGLNPEPFLTYRPAARPQSGAAAASRSAWARSASVTLASGARKVGMHWSRQRMARSAISRRRSSMSVHAAARWGSR